MITHELCTFITNLIFFTRRLYNNTNDCGIITQMESEGMKHVSLNDIHSSTDKRALMKHLSECVCVQLVM